MYFFKNHEILPEHPQISGYNTTIEHEFHVQETVHEKKIFVQPMIKGSRYFLQSLMFFTAKMFALESNSKSKVCLFYTEFASHMRIRHAVFFILQLLTRYGLVMKNIKCT